MPVHERVTSPGRVRRDHDGLSTVTAMDDQTTEFPTLEIGPSGRTRAVVTMIAVLGSIAAVCLTLAFILPGDNHWTVLLLPFQFVGTLAPYVVTSLRTTITIGPDQVAISGGGRVMRGSWSWADLTECVMVRQGGPWTIGFRPRGSTWDSPGPTAPAFGQVTFPNAAARDEARDLLVRLCEHHGVPFSEELDGLGSAPPGSPLRS